MELPDWSQVRLSLEAAIRDALPLLVNKANGDRIAGVGVDIHTCYGDSGIYLLPESAALTMTQKLAISLGDWPLATYWSRTDDYSVAFEAHWGKWAKWFYAHCGQFDKDETEKVYNELIRVVCEAVRELEIEGLFDCMVRTEQFRIIIAEHDEPNEVALARYPYFLKTGNVLYWDDLLKQG